MCTTRKPSCTTSSTRKDYRAEAEKIRSLVADRSQKARNLLDVACGTGSHLVHLRDWYAVEGLDLNPDLLTVAARRLPGVALHQGDMREFDLGRTFDVVTCPFSSIGYVETTDGLSRAVEAKARHVGPSLRLPAACKSPSSER